MAHRALCLFSGKLCAGTGAVHCLGRERPEREQKTVEK